VSTSLIITLTDCRDLDRRVDKHNINPSTGPSNAGERDENDSIIRQVYLFIYLKFWTMASTNIIYYFSCTALEQDTVPSV
jgi:hypothetical protein